MSFDVPDSIWDLSLKFTSVIPNRMWRETGGREPGRTGGRRGRKAGSIL